MIKRLIGAVALAALAALAVAGCGEVANTITPKPGTANQLTVELDWFPNADHVGIYEAQTLGYFKQADLDVHLETPGNAATPLGLLAAGKVDIAISYEPDVLLARNQNVALVSVGAIVQRPLTSIISVGSQHITTPAKLAGKTVGDAGIPYQHDFLQTILKQAGVNPASVKEIDLNEDLVTAMLTGKVNATLGGYWNYEAIELDQRHRHPNVIPVDQAGVPTYDELVFVVRKATIVYHAQLIRRFLHAVARGYEAARANPVAAAQNLVKLNPGLDYKLQLAAVEATLTSFFPTGGHPWGWQNASQWNVFANWMFKEGLLSNANAPVDASDNELLAGQGV